MSVPAACLEMNNSQLPVRVHVLVRIFRHAARAAYIITLLAHKLFTVITQHLRSSYVEEYDLCIMEGSAQEYIILYYIYINNISFM